MRRRPPRSTRTVTLVPFTTRFRSPNRAGQNPPLRRLGAGGSSDRGEDRDGAAGTSRSRAGIPFQVQAGRPPGGRHYGELQENRAGPFRPYPARGGRQAANGGGLRTLQEDRECVGGGRCAISLPIGRRPSGGEIGRASSRASGWTEVKDTV